MLIYVVYPQEKSSIVLGGASDYLFLPRWSHDGLLIAAEDRHAGLVVLLDETGAVERLQACPSIRGQKFMEIWNFDVH